MAEFGISIQVHIDEFNLFWDLESLNETMKDEDDVVLLLCPLLIKYKHFREVMEIELPFP